MLARRVEGHRREPARGSWDAQWAGSGKTQVTRQNRALCGLGPRGLSGADLASAGLPLALVVAALWLLVAWTVRPALQGIFQK